MTRYSVGEICSNRYWCSWNIGILVFSLASIGGVATIIVRHAIGRLQATGKLGPELLVGKMLMRCVLVICWLDLVYHCPDVLLVLDGSSPPMYDAMRYPYTSNQFKSGIVYQMIRELFGLVSMWGHVTVAIIIYSWVSRKRTRRFNLARHMLVLVLVMLFTALRITVLYVAPKPALLAVELFYSGVVIPSAVFTVLRYYVLTVWRLRAIHRHTSTAHGAGGEEKGWGYEGLWHDDDDDEEEDFDVERGVELRPPARGALQPPQPRTELPSTSSSSSPAPPPPVQPDASASASAASAETLPPAPHAAPPHAEDTNLPLPPPPASSSTPGPQPPPPPPPPHRTPSTASAAAAALRAALSLREGGLARTLLPLRDVWGAGSAYSIEQKLVRKLLRIMVVVSCVWMVSSIVKLIVFVWWAVHDERADKWVFGVGTVVFRVTGLVDALLLGGLSFYQDPRQEAPPPAFSSNRHKGTFVSDAGTSLVRSHMDTSSLSFGDPRVSSYGVVQQGDSHAAGPHAHAGHQSMVETVGDQSMVETVGMSEHMATQGMVEHMATRSMQPPMGNQPEDDMPQQHSTSATAT